MNKQAVRDSFNSLCEGSPHAVYRFEWGDTPKATMIAPKVTTIYNPWRDSRFGPECFDETGKSLNDVGMALADSLQAEGINSMPIHKAALTVIKSKRFYKN